MFNTASSAATVSEDAWIEPRTVATTALAVRRSNHLAGSHRHSTRSHPHSARSHPHSARSHSHSAGSHPHSAGSHPLLIRSHPHSARSHPPFLTYYSTHLTLTLWVNQLMIYHCWGSRFIDPGLRMNLDREQCFCWIRIPKKASAD
jgi:hypothetical protein